MAQLIDHGMLDAQQGTLLQTAFIDQGQSILIAGATNSGKTTLLNALLCCLPEYEVVVTVEDTPELQVRVPNCISLVATPGNGQTIRSLVALSKRLSPTCLVLGEIRGVGGDAYDLLMAFTSGHRGAATLHAGSARQAMASLELMFHQSLPPNAQITALVVKQFIANAITLVAFVEAIPEFDSQGQRVTQRRLAQLVRIKGVKDHDYDLQYLINDGKWVQSHSAEVPYARAA